MSVGSPTAGTWSSSQWRPDNEFETDRLSPASIHRIWVAHGLQPHRARPFKLSTDPAFVEKLTDVVGLYVNPPDKALVCCVDEKSQIHALHRSQPGLPMKPGRAGTMTHDWRCCMNTRCGWGGVARPSRDPPQEPHYGDAVEGSSQV